MSVSTKTTVTFVCPIDHLPLNTADQQMIARLNRAIAAQRVKNRAGRLLEQPIDGGLIRSDSRLLYPVQDNIPVLLADEAIDLEQLQN